MSARENLLQVHSELGYKIEALSELNNGVTSIPLILPDDHEFNAGTGTVTKVEGKERSKLYAVPEALELLKKITEPISVIAIAGLARTGKSYILSRLLGKADAFALGNTFDPKTFGIWMGSHVLRGKNEKGEKFTTVLLDTEGIDAVSATGQQDASIFVLTILLCSKLIYNSQNVPYKRDLETLQCFSQLASGIQVKQGCEAGIDDAQYFPDFLWLLRDVTLMPVKDDNDQPMDPTEYIKTKVLKRGTGLVQSNSDNVAQIMIALFPKIEAYTLPPPHGKVEVMQNIAEHHEKLNEDFRKKVTALLRRLLSDAKLRQKSGFGKAATVTGEILSIMIEKYVDAVNDPNAIPAMDDTWKNTVEVIINDTIERLVNEYREKMKASILKVSKKGDKILPLEEFPTKWVKDKSKTLMGIHKNICDNLLNELLDKVSHFGVSVKNGKSNLEELKNRFMSKIDVKEKATGKINGGAILPFVTENRNLSETYCKEVYMELFKPIRENVEKEISSYQFKDLIRDMEALMVDYERKAIGPEKMQILQMMDKQVGDSYKSHFKKLKGYQEKVMKEQEERKKIEIENQKKTKENEVMRNEMKNMQEENRNQHFKLQEKFNEQMMKMREEEAKRSAEEKQRILDLQQANFKQMSTMMEEVSRNQADTFKTMMDRMEDMQDQHSKDIENMVDAIKNMPPPKVEVQESGGGCFAADQKILTLSQNGQEEWKTLDDLKVGDKVQGYDEVNKKIIWDEIYFIAHDDDPEREQNMFQIWYQSDEEKKGCITLTGTHLLYGDLEMDTPKQAQLFQVGDLLQIEENGAFKPSKIISIEQIVKQARAPHTWRHHIIVNGVHCSVHSHYEKSYRVIMSMVKFAYWVNPNSTTSKTVKDIAEKSRPLRRLLGF